MVKIKYEIDVSNIDLVFIIYFNNFYKFHEIIIDITY